MDSSSLSLSLSVSESVSGKYLRLELCNFLFEALLLVTLVDFELGLIIPFDVDGVLKRCCKLRLSVDFERKSHSEAASTAANRSSDDITEQAEMIHARQVELPPRDSSSGPGSPGKWSKVNSENTNFGGNTRPLQNKFKTERAKNVTVQCRNRNPNQLLPQNAKINNVLDSKLDTFDEMMTLIKDA